jgi:hypothetical protein
MSQQSVKQAARRSALDAQAVLRKEWADRERRLEALAVAALTALAERDALVRDAEQRGGQALRTMTEGEDLSGQCQAATSKWTSGVLGHRCENPLCRWVGPADAVRGHRPRYTRHGLGRE